MGFKIRYRQSVIEGSSSTQEEKTIDTSDSVWDISPLNSPWANNGCYAGATPTNGSDIGTYSVATWSGWNKDSVYSDMRDMSIKPYTGSSQQNLRFMAKYNSGSYIVPRQYFNWTNLREPTVRVVDDAIESLSNYSEYDPYRRQEKSVSAGGTSNSPLNIAPLVSLQINNLIFVPLFIIKEIEYYNYDDVSSGYSSVLNPSGVLYDWADIKPEDKTPAGEHYDADLFEKGWKEIDPINEGGRRFRFCCGVFLIPYYGKCSNSYNYTTDNYIAGTNPDDGKEYGDRQVFGSVASQTDEFPIIGNTTNLTRPCLMVMTESYNTVTGGLTYSTPTGIMFGNILQTSGNVSSNILALQPSWQLSSNFQNFVATTSWTSQFFTGNRDYSNIYADLDPSASNTSPDLSIPTKIDFDINISHLYDISDLSSTVHNYIPNDNPIAFLFTKSNRAITATNCAFFSINALWHTIASLGCYVADSTTTAQKAPTGYYAGNNNHLYLGHMDTSGITDGIMLQGDDIPSSVQSGIDDIIQNTPYEPIIPKPDGDESDDPDRGDINPPSREGDNIPIHLNNRFGLFDSFLTMYNLTEGQLSNFGRALLSNPLNYRGNFQKDLSEQLSGTYDVSSILNYIVSVKMYPFSVATLSNTTVTATSKIYMGTGEFGIPIGTQCRKLTSSISVLNAGSLYVAPLTPYKDFRDYYNTNIVCYMPYCGCVELNPMDIMNTTLECYYLIDFLTGDCTALLYSIGSKGLNYPVAIANGNIGIDIPLSATNTGQLEAVKRMQNAQTAHTVVSFINSGLQALDDGMNLAKGIGEKSLDLTIDSSLNLSRDITSIIDTAFQNEANPFGANRSARSAVAMPLMPTGSGATNFMLNDSVYLQIRRGTYSKPKNYARTMGYPTTYSKQLRQVHGLTFCSGVNVSGINCTQEEKQMIRSALEGGTILP